MILAQNRHIDQQNKIKQSQNKAKYNQSSDFRLASLGHSRENTLSSTNGIAETGYAKD